MTETTPSFHQEIDRNKSAETAPNQTCRIEGENSSLEVRLRGCFITECELSDPLCDGKRISILYSDPNIDTPKLTASHPMSPVGPSEGIGGQHGFPRWADYHEFERTDGEHGEKRVAFQAKRSDIGLGLSKAFEMNSSSITSTTTIHNYEASPAQTSLGEHLYFRLIDENSHGLRVNGLTLDELFGEGSEADIMNGGKARYWASYGGKAIINFPAGHSILLDAAVSGTSQDTLGLLVWHRPGTESICFEPIVGFDPERGNQEATVEPFETVSLTTRLQLASTN